MREVDQEDPAPARAVHEHAAHQRPDRQRGAGDRAPDAEREGALRALELVREQRQRRGEHRRRPDPLRGAREVEHEPAARRRAQGRADGERDQPGGEDGAAAAAVGERARRQQRRGERERVGVDDPLQLREARVQVGPDRRQRDVDDGHVEQQHRRGRRHDGERDPAHAL